MKLRFYSLTRGCLLAGVTMAALHTPAAAMQTGQEQIHQVVHDYLAAHYAETEAADSWQRVEIEVAGLDPRLSMTPCPEPLSARLHQNQQPMGKVTVKVECTGIAPWSRYIPAMVRVYQNVVHSAHPLARGTLLSPGDLQITEVDVSTLRSTWISNPEQAVGLELRRAIPTGAIITAESLSPPVLVNRGDTVVLTAQRGSISIRQQGIALQNGELGRQISVRNANSERVVQATVTGTGEAEVVF